MKTPSFDRALVGQTIISITGAEKDSDCVEIALANGELFRMSHHQDCCESVRVVRVDGPPTLGRVISCVENTEWPAEWFDEPRAESFTWTSYHFVVQPESGEVVKFTIYWLGESNGYYSEDVSFERITN